MSLYSNTSSAATANNLTANNFTANNLTANNNLTAPPPASLLELASLSALFSTIGVVGVLGNSLVILVILLDRQMRASVTNLLITNLAVSDLVIMLVCVPEIVMFLTNQGWLLGLAACKAIRFTEVATLYSSVMSLVGVCVERYIAIIHPMKAHILCSRRKILLVILGIWLLSLALAWPNLVYHQILPVAPGFTPCGIRYPHPHHTLVHRYLESLLFYFFPLLLQLVLYVRIGRVLFRNTSHLYGHQSRRAGDRLVTASTSNGSSAEVLVQMEAGGGSRSRWCRALRPKQPKRKARGGHATGESNMLRARRGVVKMLIAGVTVYFVSFSPHQVLLVYNTLAPSSPHNFSRTWGYLILVNTMAYLSSAANPLLYSIFSKKFRDKFRHVLCCCCCPLAAGEGGRSLEPGSSAGSLMPHTRAGASTTAAISMKTFTDVTDMKQHASTHNTHQYS